MRRSMGPTIGNMLVLPTGQILFTDFSADIELYNPTIKRKIERFQREDCTGGHLSTPGGDPGRLL